MARLGTGLPMRRGKNRDDKQLGSASDPPARWQTNCTNGQDDLKRPVSLRHCGPRRQTVTLKEQL